jgi:hypothetical protein
LNEHAIDTVDGEKNSYAARSYAKSAGKLEWKMYVRTVNVLSRVVHEYWEKLIESDGVHREQSIHREVDVRLPRENLSIAYCFVWNAWFIRDVRLPFAPWAGPQCGLLRFLLEHDRVNADPSILP